MDGLPLGIFEFAISGSVLLIGIWQLISINRTIKEREAREAAEQDAKNDDEQATTKDAEPRG